MAHRRFRTLAASIVAGAVLVISSAGGASALSQSTSPAACWTEIRVASKTTGATYHSTSDKQSWYKGVKQNAGATSYTGATRLTTVTTEAPTIASSGFACR
jgi:hypothetical protein